MSSNQPGLSRSLSLTLAVSCGVTVANLYFNQPLLALIAQSFKLPVAATAPVSMATQLGYASGLLLLGPLGDRLPRKQLVLGQAAALSAVLLAASLAQSLVQLIVASFAIGLAATLAQQLVPLAAQLAPEGKRGQVVGTVMSGLLFGLLGGRIVAGFLGEAIGWRAVFATGAGLSLTMALVLARMLPNVAPAAQARYGELLGSTFRLAKQHVTLRAAALNGALLFAAFSVFWVALTPLLTGPSFGLDGRAPGMFGAVGIAGAMVAPWAGRFTDRRGPIPVLSASVATVLAAYALLALSGHSLLGLAVGTFLLDVGIQAALIANQARIFALAPEARSRVNAFFMTCYFIGGASGSLLAGLAWARAAWPGAMAAGASLTLLAGIAHFSHTRFLRRQRA